MYKICIYFYNIRKSFITTKRYDEDFTKSIVSLHENEKAFNSHFFKFPLFTSPILLHPFL